MIGAFGVGFLMGWVGSMPLAGAVSIFVFQRGLAGQFRRGILLAAGAATAEAIWCLIAVIGAEQILSRWPGLEVVAKSHLHAQRGVWVGCAHYRQASQFAQIFDQ